MKKKLFVIFLSLVMVVTMMPLSVFADSANTSDKEVVAEETDADADATAEETESDSVDNSTDYLSFTAVDGKMQLGMEKEGKAPDVTYEYSSDKSTWKDFTPGISTVEIAKDNTIYFRAKVDGQDFPGKDESSFLKFFMFGNGEIIADGNIMSMVSKDCSSTEMSSHGFEKLFKDCTKLQIAPKLSATTLADYCYSQMFEGCSSLESAPKIEEKDAHFEEDACCYAMFRDCISLKKISNESFTVGCEDIIEHGSCESMFENCISLKNGPEYLGVVPSCGRKAFAFMFKGCTSLGKSPLIGGPYDGGVSRDIYEGLFEDCSNLQYVHTTDYFCWTSGGDPLTTNWLKGVSATGTFETDDYSFDATIRDESHIPVGWKIKNPSVPQVKNFSAKAIDSKTCSLSWSKVPISGVKYQVYRSTKSTSGFTRIATTSSTSYKDTKVKPGTKYYYKVCGAVDLMRETVSGPFSKTDYGYPRLFQVTGISAKALNAAKAQITWKTNGNKNVYYQVYISTKPNKGFKRVATIKNGKTTYTQKFTPTQSGKKYYFAVRAITKDYTGKWHYGKFSKVDYAYPRVNTPTNFKAWASGKHTCKCSWSKVPGSNIKYLVYRGTKPTGNWGKAKAITSKTSFTNKNMRSGRKYYYMVRAVQTINGKKYYSAYSAKDYAYPR